MSKGVFTTRVSPAYDDVPEERYHFPRTYLTQVEKTVGDWIVYYEPRRTSGDGRAGGRQAYFAIARVDRITEDQNRPDHFYAHISGYLNFAKEVPFKLGDEYFELGLKKNDGSTNKGAFGRAVRNISEHEFDMISQAGFLDDEHVPLFNAPYEPAAALIGFHEDQAPFQRPIIETLVARPFRDRAFRHSVRNAYKNRCAITGLKLINGGGRPEVQAAHIRAVEDDGPDSVRNGLALSGTVHWMFDRGLISVDDEFKLLAPEKNIPDELRPLIHHGRPLLRPDNEKDWPHQRFLQHHRETRFKG